MQSVCSPFVQKMRRAYISGDNFLGVGSQWVCTFPDAFLCTRYGGSIWEILFPFGDTHSHLNLGPILLLVLVHCGSKKLSDNMSQIQWITRVGWHSSFNSWTSCSVHWMLQSDLYCYEQFKIQTYFECCCWNIPKLNANESNNNPNKCSLTTQRKVRIDRF